MDKNTAIIEMAAAAAALATASERMHTTAAAAAAAGASWAEIGKVLGISKQTAYNRHADAAKRWEDAMAKTDEAVRESNDLHEEITATLAENETAKILDAAAPATRKSPSKKIATAAPATATDKPFRRLHTIPIPDTTAQPGIGKGHGPHQCPACGDTNHKTEHKDFAAFTSQCIPTQYDPPKIAYLMHTTND